MMEEIPIMLGGVQKGSLHVERQGLLTVFTAECEPTEGILRLSVYGEDGTEGRLGVMLPEGDRLRLRKAFSRSAMAGFPQKLLLAAESGGLPETVFSAPEEEEGAPPEPPPCPEEEPETSPGAAADTLWFPVPEGTLVSLRTPAMLAMPWHDGLTQGQERVIEGRRYAVIRPEEIAIPADL